MTDEELKKLKDRLWESADALRANSGLKSTEYATPILGLIFLRFAESKYRQYEKAITAEYNKTKGTRVASPLADLAVEKCGFYLPDNARYDYLLNLPESENLAEKLKEAMIAVEKYTPDLAGTLPKDEYYKVNGKDDKTVLKKLLKTFKDIPDDVGIDIFGEIYEYFLGQFALSEGQGGGEFFTPSTVVRYMVEVLAPTEGNIFDPACGSGGMFVQTARYIERHKKAGRVINLRAYGVEKIEATVKLAKMNLILNNVRGTITEANSYYNDPYDCFGHFDYVMANPPFNVDDVDLENVKKQPRFNTYGVPQNKTKTKKNAAETVPNANYLWISLFATSLAPHGRAALVMANSASDAGNSEKEIRKRIVDSGLVSQMVTLPSNMFTTVTLPATLWFFDNEKKHKDEILFIDARNVFTQIDRAHRKFSDEQIRNLALISRLYEGKSEEFTATVDEYLQKSARYRAEFLDALGKCKTNKEYELNVIIEKAHNENEEDTVRPSNAFRSLDEYALTGAAKQSEAEKAAETLSFAEFMAATFKKLHANLHDEKLIASKQDSKIKIIEEQASILQDQLELCRYFAENAKWLLDRFPEGKYADVTGLCKAAKLAGEDGVVDQDYSLNPGRYVGVVIEDDGMTKEEFKAEMLSLDAELAKLGAEARELEQKISENLRGLAK